MAPSVEEAEKSLYDERFLLARPVLAALQQSPAVLLVDEVDRADDEFEAFLLEVLSTYQVTIPELGTVKAATPPVVVLTSNRTRELHDALKRRCLYHWIDHPGLEREVRDRPLPGARGLRPSWPGRSSASCSSCATATLQKPPGVAETLDWARALHHLGTTDLDLESSARDPRCAGEVPRGQREGAAGARPDAARLMGGTVEAPTVVRGGDEILLGFARALRAAGVPSPRTAPRASSRRSRWSASATRGRRTSPGRSTLCASPDDLARYDAGARGLLQRPRRAAPDAAGRGPRRRPSSQLPETEGDGDGAGEDEEPDVVRRHGQRRPRCCATATSPR